MIDIQDSQQYYNKTFNDLAIGSLLISAAEFEECEFNACDFSSATLAHCKFVNCNFNHCNFSLAQMDYSQFLEVSFIECKMIGIDWTKANWPTFIVDPELSFIRCIMNDSSFFGLTLHGMILEECKLHEVDFRGGDFSNACMTYCDFSHSLFMRTNLHKADLTESTHFTINVLENNLKQAKFSRYEALSLLDSLGIELVD